MGIPDHLTCLLRKLYAGQEAKVRGLGDLNRKNWRSNYLNMEYEGQLAVLYREIITKYVNCELPDVQAGFRKGRGTRGQITNIHWIIKKARNFQKNIYFCFIDYAKAFDCVDHNKL